MIQLDLLIFTCLFAALQVSAVFAADAVARMTGTVGAVAVTAGPGLTNTVTAIKNAQMAESPILLIGWLPHSFFQFTSYNIY